MKRILILIAIMVLIIGTAQADKVWVLCNPQSYVNIRARPSGGSSQEGYALCGDSFETDGKTKNGFLHIFAPIESGEGWISLNYIVWDEPVEVNARYYICSPCRVAVRKAVNGKRQRWAHTLDEFQVYWMSETWAVTNNGFIKSEFLEEDHGE